MTSYPDLSEMKIEHLPIAQLIPYAHNARTHSEEQVCQIANSMREFGFVNPILMGDDQVIIAGHGRLMAAQKLALKNVPVIRLAHLSEAQRQALVIADNKIANNAGWNDDLLKQELQALEKLDFDLDLLGFSTEELDGFLQEAGIDIEDSADEDSVPDVPEVPVSRLGDLWICGDHKVLCGDSTLAESYTTLLNGETADMVFTDPPYNVNYINSPRGKMRGTPRAIQNDNLGTQFGAFLSNVCAHLMTFCAGAFYICMGSSELHTLHSAFTQAGGKWSTFIIWVKNAFALGVTDYQRQFEPILYGWKEGSDYFWCGARNQSDVWFIDRAFRNDLHPTMKPVALVERALLNSSQTHGRVLDAFGGSGSTLIACENTRRRARLIEIAPQYVDVIVQRWEALTGKQALLDKNGQGFEEVRKQRGEKNLQK